jgi:hypothetical protein
VFWLTWFRTTPMILARSRFSTEITSATAFAWFLRPADNEHSIGGGGHLEALRKAQQGRRIQNHQIVFLRELVQQRGKPRAYQVGCAMGAQSSRQETQVWPALDRENDILPRPVRRSEHWKAPLAG